VEQAQGLDQWQRFVLGASPLVSGIGDSRMGFRQTEAYYNIRQVTLCVGTLK
jgi:hypothetical protein